MMLTAAALFDVENITGGYGLREGQNINWYEINQTIEDIRFGEEKLNIIIKKAYANFSHERLARTREALSKLSIEQIQLTGFNREQMEKNFADHQLTAGLVELAFIRKDLAIDVFVIVSGDGGFSEIAKTLKQAHKQVIVLAYENSISISLKNVCDVFIPLPRTPFSLPNPQKPYPLKTPLAEEKVDYYYNALEVNKTKLPKNDDYSDVNRYILYLLDILRINKNCSALFSRNGVHVGALILGLTITIAVLTNYIC